jgi:hypothetical protein
MMRRDVGWGAAVAALALGLLGAGGARASDRADFALGFGTRAPGSATTMTLHILYKAPGDPDAKPPAIRSVTIQAPRGTRFDPGAVAACTASDAELYARGRDACPRGSLVGTGSLSVMSGLGPLVDPLPTDVWIYSTPEGVVELVQQPGTNVTLGFDRLTLEGTTFSGHPGFQPGAPPDGSSVRRIDWLVDAPGYVTTPERCPRSGWIARGAFAFADGSSTSETSVAPCRRRTRIR